MDPASSDSPSQPVRPPRPRSSCVAPPFVGLALAILGLGATSARVGGTTIGWVLLGVYGVYADMFLIVAGIGLAGIGVVFSVMGLIGNIIRRRKPLVIVAAVALALGAASLVCGGVYYDRYLPTYKLAKEALESHNRQTAGLSSQPAR